MDPKLKLILVKYARIFAIVLLLFAVFRGILVLAVLFVLSLAMSFLVNSLNLRQIGFELVTFIAVLAGMSYGPWVSLAITFILITYHLLAGGFFGPYVFWVIPAYCMAGVASGFFPGANPAVIGTFATIGINLNNSLFTLITSPGFFFKHLPYTITNIIFNIFLFNLLGGIILSLL